MRNRVYHDTYERTREQRAPSEAFPGNYVADLTGRGSGVAIAAAVVMSGAWVRVRSACVSRRRCSSGCHPSWVMFWPSRSRWPFL